MSQLLPWPRSSCHIQAQDLELAWPHAKTAKIMDVQNVALHIQTVAPLIKNNTEMQLRAVGMMQFTQLLECQYPHPPTEKATVATGLCNWLAA